MNECKVEPGSFAQVVLLRPRFGHVIAAHPIGEYERVLSAGYSLVNSSQSYDELLAWSNRVQPDEHIRRLFIDAFLAEQFRRKDLHGPDYKLTAAVAGLLFRTHRAIVYPSVQKR